MPKPAKNYFVFDPKWLLLPGSYEEAIEKGSSFYYVPKNKCKKMGHISPRYASSRACAACGQIRSALNRKGEFITPTVSNVKLPLGAKLERVRGRLSPSDDSRNMSCQFYDTCLAWSWYGFLSQGIRWGQTWVCGKECAYRG